MVSWPYRQYIILKQANKLENVSVNSVSNPDVATHFFTLSSLYKPLQWGFSTHRPTLKCWASVPNSMFII